MLINNIAVNGGGAAICQSYSCQVLNNKLDDSIFPSHGGGLYLGTAINTIITNNQSGTIDATLINCTLANNFGLDVFMYNGQIVNTIIWGTIFIANMEEVPNVSNSAFSECNMEIPGALVLDYNNTTGPQFVNPSDTIGIVTTLEGIEHILAANWALQPTSPCIGVGNNNSINNEPYDLSGAPRICGAFIDLGAYEYQKQTIAGAFGFTVDYINETTEEDLADSLYAYTIPAYEEYVTGNNSPLALLPDNADKQYLIFYETDTAIIADTLIVPARPAAPVNPVVDDAANTFAWGWSPSGYTQLSDYEISTNNGADWSNAGANPFEVGNITLPAGDVLVRVKASDTPGSEHFKSIPLASDNNFTIITPSTEILSEGIQIYPTATHDIVHIELNAFAANAYFELYDNHGRKVLTREITGQETLSVESFAPGIYFYSLAWNKTIYKGKLVKL